MAVRFGWMEAGRTYFEDLLDYDVYSVIGAYDKDVLLIHGDADGGFEMLLVTDGGEIYLTEGIADDFTLNGNVSDREIQIIRK